jgi:MFS family permease
LILFAFNTWHAVALLLLFVIGLSATSVFASSNALIQLSVPNQIRGRVMALFSVALQGMISIGQLAMGAAADTLRVPVVVAGCGTALLVVTFVLAIALFRMPQDVTHIIN